MKRTLNAMPPPQLVKDILQRVSESEASYAPVANQVLVTLSGSSPALIDIPPQVMDLMDRGIIPMRITYTQSDVYAVMESLAAALRSTLVEVDLDEDEPDLTDLIQKHSTVMRSMTNDQLKDVTLDFYDGLPRLERYAVALSYLDVMVDRGLSASANWLLVVTDYTKSNDGE